MWLDISRCKSSNDPRWQYRVGEFGRMLDQPCPLNPQRWQYPKTWSSQFDILQVFFLAIDGISGHSYPQYISKTLQGPSSTDQGLCGSWSLSYCSASPPREVKNPYLHRSHLDAGENQSAVRKKTRMTSMTNAKFFFPSSQSQIHKAICTTVGANDEQG